MWSGLGVPGACVVEKHTQVHTENMEASSSRSAVDIKCLIRENGKQCRTGSFPAQALQQMSRSMEALRWTLSAYKHWKIFSTLEQRNWQSPRTIRFTQVTALEHVLPHWGLGNISKRVFPIPGCWWSLTTRSDPFSSPASPDTEKKGKKKNFIPITLLRILTLPS